MRQHPQAAVAEKAKRKSAEHRERMGETYRAFHYARRGEVPPGAYYDLGDEARETWRARAETVRQHTVAYGLVQP